MTAAVPGVPVEGAVARVLAEHGYEWFDGLNMLYCDCGWAMDAYIDYEDGLAERDSAKAGHDGREIAVVIRHRAHVAEMVTASLREQIAAEERQRVKDAVSALGGASGVLRFDADTSNRIDQMIEQRESIMGAADVDVPSYRDRIAAEVLAPVRATIQTARTADNHTYTDYERGQVLDELLDTLEAALSAPVQAAEEEGGDD